MMAIGLPLNLLSILVTFLAISTWGRVMFDLDTFPEWANYEVHANGTKALLDLNCTSSSTIVST